MDGFPYQMFLFGLQMTAERMGHYIQVYPVSLLLSQMR